VIWRSHCCALDRLSPNILPNPRALQVRPTEYMAVSKLDLQIPGDRGRVNAPDNTLEVLLGNGPAFQMKPPL